MKKSFLILVVLLIGTVMTNAQTKSAIISTGTAKYGNFVTTVSGKKAVGGAHEITSSDLIEVTTYKPTQTQDPRLPTGNSYNVFMISSGAARDPQSMLYFATDKPAWQDALRAAGSFKVVGLGVLAGGKKNTIKKGDYYTLRAQQDKPNDQIYITFDVFRTENSKQISVATFSGYTKAMKWPQ